MKKYFICSMVVLLAIMIAVATPITTGMKAAGMTPAPSKTLSANTQAIPLSTQSIVPLSATIPDGATDPSTTLNNPLYTENNKQVYMLREAGLLVTQDGNPIMDKNSSITKFDIETQEYTNGADQKLSIYLNSFLDKHYLRSGGNYVTEINTHREIFLINIKTSDGGRMAIYTYREKVNHGISIIWKPGKWFNTEYRYYDMNGRLIENKYIAEWDTATFMKAMGGNILFFLATGGIGFIGQLIFGNSDNFGVPYVKVYEKTTLADLVEELSHITIHPYPTVQGIVTEDGNAIYIRPTTKQCVDKFNFPIFSIENGLPTMFYDGQIITTNLQAVEVRNGILRNCVSVWQLLESETDFYMGSIPTPFGEMDAVVFNLSNDVDNPNWKLPNGDDADGIIKDMELGKSLDGDEFSIGGLFDSLKDWIWIVIIILLIIFIGIPCLPMIIELVKMLFSIIIAPFKWLAKKVGGGT